MLHFSRRQRVIIIATRTCRCQAAGGVRSTRCGQTSHGSCRQRSRTTLLLEFQFLASSTALFSTGTTCRAAPFAMGSNLEIVHFCHPDTSHNPAHTRSNAKGAARTQFAGMQRANFSVEKQHGKGLKKVYCQEPQPNRFEIDRLPKDSRD